jgi:hypothetical protein
MRRPVPPCDSSERGGNDDMTSYSADEILETHRSYLEVRAEIEAGRIGWKALARFFTDDATFVDPAWGRVDGIVEIEKFLVESMTGLEDWSFPHQWEAVDGNHLVTGWLNRLPGQRADGSYYQAPGVSRMVYAGGGKFSFEQDLLNMAHVYELIAESGWKPSGEIHVPPGKPVRFGGWQP